MITKTNGDALCDWNTFLKHEYNEIRNNVWEKKLNVQKVKLIIVSS